MSTIIDVHPNIFSVTRELQKGYQVTSEGDTLILKKNPTEVRFDGKMTNKYGKGFLPTTNLYKIANEASILDPEKRNPEGKADVQLDGMEVKNQENTTTKKLATQKVHTNKLHMKLGHTGEYMILSITKLPHCSIKRMLEVCDDCSMEKIKSKFLHKAAKQRALNPGEMV